SKMLGEYMTTDNTPVKARNIKSAGAVLKGYYVLDLHDAWQRYCPPPPSGAATSATSATAQVSGPETVAAELFPSAT
ncbi:DNA primase, partial [Streptomyces sp. NPDC088252]